MQFNVALRRFQGGSPPRYLQSAPGPEGHTLGTRTGASKRGCSRRTGPGSWTRRGLALGSPVVGGQGGEIRCSAPRITAFHATVKCSRRFRKKPRPRGWPEPRGTDSQEGFTCRPAMFITSALAARGNGAVIVPIRFRCADPALRYSGRALLLYLNIFPFSSGGGLRSAACIPVPASDASTVSFSRD
jgi:hypothetical protein